MVSGVGDLAHAMLKPINLRSLWLIVVVLGASTTSAAFRQAVASANQGGPQAGTAPDHPAAAVYNHSVKLSWGRSRPATNLARDAVVGYYVYRSAVSHDPKPQRINSKPWADTTYTDPEVEPGKTYFYVARGVTAKGVESGPSNEVKVVMPSL